jgi:SAM-dependent methyltransferase
VSRLEAVATGLYFPTPPRVAHAITGHLTVAPHAGRQTIRLLDPCAGTGEAAALVARALGATSFGIELNTDRALAARARLNHVLVTSAFAVRLANGAFSLLFLNPPYDQDDEKRRLEHAFLTAVTRVLCPGGILVFLIPQARLCISARFLAAHYTRFSAYRFPDPEFAAFRQMVLLAERRPAPTNNPAAQAQLETWATSTLPPLPDIAEQALLAVPSVSPGDILFTPLAFDPELAAQDARRSGVWVQPAFADQIWPMEDRPVRPLMPLRRGHLALLIAAGLLDNVVLPHRGRRLLVKGRVHKEFVSEETDEGNVDIEREILRTSIVVLDLGSGAIEVLDDGSDQADIPQAA